MNLPNLGGLVSIGRAFVAANRPEILFGTSVVSTLSAVVMAARGGYKSGQQVAEAEVEHILRKLPAEACSAYEQEVKNPENQLTTKQIAQLTWINYLPAAGATLASVGSTTGLHLVHVKEKKQLTAAALMAIEQVRKEGEDFKNEITKALPMAKFDDQKEIKKAAGSKGGPVNVMSSDGVIETVYLVRDEKTQRDFWSNKQRIEEAVLEVNRRLNLEDTELNCFYTMANMGGIPEGEEIGWNAGTVLGIEWDTTINDAGQPVRTFQITPGADNTARSA